VNPRDRSGVALPTVLLALLLLETLVAVTFVAVFAGARAARWAVAEAGARGAQDAGLVRAREAEWQPAWDTVTRSTTIAAARLPGGGMFTSAVVHLGPRLTATVVEGSVERDDARSVAAELGVRRPIVPHLDAALISGGQFDVSGTLTAEGQPSSQSEWSACVAPRAAAARLELPGLAAVALFDSLPHQTWRPFSLPAPSGVGVVIPEPAELGGVCLEGLWTNWGDPLDPSAACGAHFAIVYYDGALRIAGGRGQGTLIVAGDLTVAGGFVFHGLVAVRGRLVVEDPGFFVVGTLLVGEVLGQRHAVRGTLAVQYSKCFVELGLPASGKPDRLPGPSWLQLSDVP